MADLVITYESGGQVHEMKICRGPAHLTAEEVLREWEKVIDNEHHWFNKAMRVKVTGVRLCQDNEE